MFLKCGPAKNEDELEAMAKKDFSAVLDFDDDDFDPTLDMPGLVVVDSEGKRVRLENVVEQRLTLIFLIRGWGCIMGKQLASKISAKVEQFEELGVQLVVVANGTSDGAGKWRKETQFPGSVFCDQDNVLVKTLSCKRGYKYILSPRSLLSVQKALAEGFRSGGNISMSDSEQSFLGGALAYGKKAGIIFQHLERNLGDHVDLDQIITAVRRYQRDHPDRTWGPLSYLDMGIFHTRAIASSDGMAKPYHFERGSKSAFQTISPTADLPRLLDFAFYTRMFQHREHSLWLRKLPDDYHPDSSDDPYGAIVVALAKETNGDYTCLVYSRVGVRRRVVFAHRDLSEKDCVKFLIQSEVIVAHTMLPVAPSNHNWLSRQTAASDSGNSSTSNSSSNGDKTEKNSSANQSSNSGVSSTHSGSSSTNNVSSSKDASNAGPSTTSSSEFMDAGTKTTKAEPLPIPKMRKTSNFNAVRSELIKWEAQERQTGYKYGILLAKEGETTEEEIYNGSATTTPLFEAFLSTLGDRVDLIGYTGYAGGLDCKYGRTGQQSLKTCLDDSNVMFHVASMIPATSSEGNIAKKRHIGNDMGVVIFKEGNEDLDVGAFRTQFNHFFIVVRPIRDSEDSNANIHAHTSPTKDANSNKQNFSDSVVQTQTMNSSQSLNTSTSSLAPLNQSSASSISAGDANSGSNFTNLFASSGSVPHLNTSSLTSSSATSLTNSGTLAAPASPSSASQATQTPIFLGSTQIVSAFPASTASIATATYHSAVARPALVHSALQTTTFFANGKTVSATPTATPLQRFSIEVISKKGVPPSPPFLTENARFELGPYMRQWLLTKLLNLERMTQETVPIFRGKLEKVRAMAMWEVTLVANGKKAASEIPAVPAPELAAPVSTSMRRGSLIKKTGMIESSASSGKLQMAQNISNANDATSTSPAKTSSPPPMPVIPVYSGIPSDKSKKGLGASGNGKISLSQSGGHSQAPQLDHWAVSSTKLRDKKEKKEKTKRGRSGSMIEDPDKPSAAIKHHGSQGSPSQRSRMPPSLTSSTPNHRPSDSNSPASCLSDSEYSTSSSRRPPLTSSHSGKVDRFRPAVVSPNGTYFNLSPTIRENGDRSNTSSHVSPKKTSASPHTHANSTHHLPNLGALHKMGASSPNLSGPLPTIGETISSPRATDASKTHANALQSSQETSQDRFASPARPTRPAPARDISPNRSGGYTSDISPSASRSSKRSPSPLRSPVNKNSSTSDRNAKDAKDAKETILRPADLASRPLPPVPDKQVARDNSNFSVESTIPSQGAARPARAAPTPIASPVPTANPGGVHAPVPRSTSSGVVFSKPSPTSSPASSAANSITNSNSSSNSPATLSVRPIAPQRPAPSTPTSAPTTIGTGDASPSSQNSGEILDSISLPSTPSKQAGMVPSSSASDIKSSSVGTGSSHAPGTPETAIEISNANLSPHGAESPLMESKRRRSANLQRTSSGYDSDKLAASLARQAELSAEGKASRATPEHLSETKVAHKAAFNSVKERWAQLQADPLPETSPTTPKRKLISARSVSDLRPARSSIKK